MVVSYELKSILVNIQQIKDISVFHGQVVKNNLPRIVYPNDEIMLGLLQVDQALADGRPFICGEKFTAADLTFASLAAPVILPKG